MTTTLPPLTDLCPRCQVLEFDDSAWPGAYKAGSATEEYYLEVPRGWEGDPTSTSGHLTLDYELLDSLPGLPLLSEGERNGCGFCSVLKRAIQRCARARSRRVKVYLSYMWHQLSPKTTPRFIGLKSLAADCGWIENDKVEEISYLGFGIDAPLGSCSRWLRLEHPPRNEALCPENVQMIANSLKKRKNKQTYSDGDMYPARFIEVGEQGTLSCRLVETHSHPEFTQPSLVPYAALSYCWGPQEDAAIQFKTERCSLEDRLNGFRMDQITPILRDAILTTRALKIPYLWVDVVCIVQNDDEDWDKESSRMILVYQNAALTICTPASASCQQGVLARDWSMTRIKFRSKIDETVSGSYTLRFVSEVPVRWYTACDDLTFALRLSSWAKRGWVLQEFQLSQRTLVFDKTKLHILTDIYVQSEGSELRRSVESIGTSRLRSYINILPWYVLWLDIVDKYSRCELSYLSDKLPAISALARHILPSSLPNYYAGHIFLHIDLFWVLKKWGRPQCFKTQDALIQSLQFQDPYVAPSWSWASRSHTVGFGNWSFFGISESSMSWCNLKEECEFVQVSISLAGRDLFGKVRDGSLVIRGAVVPLSPRIELLGDITIHEKCWKMTENDKYVAYLNFDWDKFEDKDSFEKLSLVLLGSCKARSDKPLLPLDGIHEAESDDKLQGSSAEGEGEYADITENDLAYEADSECAIHVGERGETAEEDDQNHDRSEQGSGISSKEDVPNTSGTGHNKAYVYPLITPAEPGKWVEVTIHHAKPGGERHAYGIVIHPASAAGKYLRVGAFYSVPIESGGLEYFQNRPTQTVDII